MADGSKTSAGPLERRPAYSLRTGLLDLARGDQAGGMTLGALAYNVADWTKTKESGDRGPRSVVSLFPSINSHQSSPPLNSVLTHRGLVRFRAWTSSDKIRQGGAVYTETNAADSCDPCKQILGSKLHLDVAQFGPHHRALSMGDLKKWSRTRLLSQHSFLERSGVCERSVRR